MVKAEYLTLTFFSVPRTELQIEVASSPFGRKTFLPHQSSHSRSRQVKHAQNKFNSDKYTLMAVRVRSGTLFLQNATLD